MGAARFDRGVDEVEASRRPRMLWLKSGRATTRSAPSATATTTSRVRHDSRADIQTRLMELAVVEIDDALADLAVGDIYPIAQQRLGESKDEIALGLAATSWSVRKDRISNAISRCLNARDIFGSTITYVLGKGNLMF